MDNNSYIDNYIEYIKFEKRLSSNTIKNYLRDISLLKKQSPNKDFKSKQHSLIKTKSIDLHGYTLDEANKVINNFIKNCYEEKVNKIIVVTGKGLHSENEKTLTFQKI